MFLFTAYLTSLCKTRKSLSDQMKKSNGKPVMNKNPNKATLSLFNPRQLYNTKNKAYQSGNKENICY